MSWDITFKLPTPSFDVDAVKKAIEQALEQYPGARIDDEDEWAEEDAEWAEPDEFETFSDAGGRVAILLPWEAIASRADCEWVPDDVDEEGVPVEIDFVAGEDGEGATISVESNAAANRGAWAIVADIAENVALALGASQKA